MLFDRCTHHLLETTFKPLKDIWNNYVSVAIAIKISFTSGLLSAILKMPADESDAIYPRSFSLTYIMMSMVAWLSVNDRRG
jgi:hypothetical protein